MQSRRELGYLSVCSRPFQSEALGFRPYRLLLLHQQPSVFSVDLPHMEALTLNGG